jgi:2-(1,2-epoxy-1,2-dihydrophenyl)acetyl-CoA isomerase
MKALDEIDRRHDEVRCVIMTGEGRGFCAGANLQPASGARGDAGMLLETVFHPFLRRPRELAVPLITAVNASVDFKEGVRAFLQKRPANFKGA